MIPPQDRDDMFDLESSSQIELGRVPGCDSEKAEIRFDSAECEHPPRQTRACTRELLQNDFPLEI